MALQFLHPHIETVVTDSSNIVETSTQNGTVLFQPFISDKGVDNKIVRYTSKSEFINANGNPNFKKHGQSIYNIVNWLENGGQVLGIRLMPEDATLANTVLNIKTKVDDVAQTISVYTEMVSIEDVVDTKTLMSKMVDTVTFPATDSNGFKSFPLFAFYTPGRGEYGNVYSIRMNYNYSERGTYTLSLLSTDEKGIVRELEGPYVVSTNPDATNASGTSMFIKNVMDGYSKILNVHFNEAAYDLLLAELTPYLPEGTLAEEIDFLFARDLELNEYEKIKLDDGRTNTKIEKFEGVRLAGGKDGSLAYRTPGRQNKINELLNSLFTGVSNPEILNKRSLPIDVILDANYDKSVKKNMVNFVDTLRTDVMAFLDTGLSNNNTEAVINWKNDNLNVSSYHVALYAQEFLVSDPYTLCDIAVTMPYFLAKIIPTNDRLYGVQYPLAGPARGIISGFKAGSLNFEPNEQEQEDLYLSRINFSIQDFTTTEINCNLTTQARMSALSDINNARTLLKIVREVEEVSRNYKFEHSDTDLLSQFSAELNTIAANWVENKACSYLSIVPYQTDYDKEQKVCRVKLDLTFTGIIERIVIEVNIGK